MNNDNLIMYQSHINKHKITELNKKNKSQDKHTTNKELKVLVKELKLIYQVVCNECVKSARDLVVKDKKHSETEV
jgi:hypothetical protein